MEREEKHSEALPVTISGPARYVLHHAYLSELLAAFVAQYSGLLQHTPEWISAMAETFGGSEMAALMGRDRYKSLDELILAKAAARLGHPEKFMGGPACWWGTLFQDVVAAYLEIDTDSTVLGDKICIRAHVGHRNSPDGYIVAWLLADGNLWTTDLDPALRDRCVVLLIEIKCPHTRKPDGKVPINYRPQLWSGLAVSPLASHALFIDSVVRKCSIADLGPGPEYDEDYHFRDNEHWELPVAWGVIAVYAPLMSAPIGVRKGWRGPEWAPGDPTPDLADRNADGAFAAWEINASHFGRGMADEVADVGDMPRGLFERTLGLIDCRRFPVRRGAPTFADGRGCRDSYAAQVAAFGAATPEHHRLFGLLAWKLFEVDYVPAARSPGFLEELLPRMEAAHSKAKAAADSGDPVAFLAAGRPPPPAGRAAGMSDADVQDFFDTLA